MDQKRLILAIAVSLAIMLGFQAFVAPHLPKPPPQVQNTAGAPASLSSGSSTGTSPGTSTGTTASTEAQSGSEQEANRVPANAPRVSVPINAKKLTGSINLLGARLDDIVLNDYRETVQPDLPHVRLLEPQSGGQPYFVQYYWAAPAGATVALPREDTLWTTSDGPLISGGKITLSWNNGQGLTFRIEFAIDDEYMFTVHQSVRNATGQPVPLLPQSRVRRDYKPVTAGYYILHEGMLGFFDGSLKETTYDKAKSEGEKKGGIALDAAATGGWAGITDKYWLTADDSGSGRANESVLSPH